MHRITGWFRGSVKCIISTYHIIGLSDQWATGSMVRGYDNTVQGLVYPPLFRIWVFGPCWWVYTHQWWCCQQPSLQDIWCMSASLQCKPTQLLQDFLAQFCDIAMRTLGSYSYLIGKRRLYFWCVGLSVCLSVYGQHYFKCYEWIGMKFYGGVLGSTMKY